MNTFFVRCHVHGRGPFQGCPECKTALDVNFVGHNTGTCITARCWWHNNPQWQVRPIPMLAWER